MCRKTMNFCILAYSPEVLKFQSYTSCKNDIPGLKMLYTAAVNNADSYS